MPEQQGATPQPPPSQIPRTIVRPHSNRTRQIASAGTKGQQADPQGTERPADPAQSVTKEITEKLHEAATKS